MLLLIYLQVLIRGDRPDVYPDNNNSLLDGGGGPCPPGQSPLISRPSGYTLSSIPTAGKECTLSPEGQNPYSKAKAGFFERHYSFGKDDSSHPSELDKEDRGPRMERHQYARSEQRTIVAQNFSDRTTAKDLLHVIRGGAVLDIFLRSNDRSASISFVEGNAAQEFMNHVRRADIYIHGKRVEWAWSERQFILPGHVANKISIGATRNLVVRSIHPNITEQRVREDLDHIHNLAIVDIAYRSGDMIISLNSVHNAMFARTCMMSRFTYKGMRIEWFPDDCSSPLPKPPVTPKRENVPTPAKKPSTGTNRFQMLNIDGTEDGSSDDDSVKAAEENVLPTFAAMRINNHRSPWNPTTIAA